LYNHCQPFHVAASQQPKPALLIAHKTTDSLLACPPLLFLLSPLPGDNRIILHGGANMAAWQLDDATRAAISSAGAVLLQREIPEGVNAEVAQVRGIALCCVRRGTDGAWYLMSSRNNILCSGMSLK
jgi:hypothetical protein